jgi:putative two-component system hydrogenase maturation factor HypX/HoxX
MSDLVREIVETDSHLAVSALAGDAAAGGVPLALAAGYVVARKDVVLNPYYRHTGGLFGSEYWTYLLPRRVGRETSEQLTGPPFRPVGAQQAAAIGLLDAALGADLGSFDAEVRDLAERLARRPDADRSLEAKRRRRARDQAIKPLHAYRAAEMARCHGCFFGPDPGYHEARRRFVYKSRSTCAVPFERSGTGTAAPRSLAELAA